MDRRVSPTPAQIRAVFSANLQILLEREPSVAAVCRLLGVNRTQFNRFLAGEAYPRPDILQLICSHFGTDARILTEPLAGILTTERSRTGERLRELMLPEGSRPFDHYFFPDGYYRYWRRSFSSPRHYACGVWRLRSDGEIKHVSGADVYGYPVRRGGRRYSRQLPWHGVITQGFDGVVMITRAESERLLTTTYLEAGVQSSTRYISGLSMLARRRMSGAMRFSPLLAEHLTGSYAELLAAARMSGLVSAEQLPPQVLAQLTADEAEH